MPQGSVLGPCLFIMYINDIDSAIDTVMLVMKFADDTKGCGVVDHEEDCMKLQNELNKLQQWSLDWQMLFNMDKCKVIHLGSGNLHYDYKMGDKYLKKVDSEKDLGVYIHSSLSPSLQIAESVKKANQVLGQLLRSVMYRDKFHFVRLYQQRVRCHLEQIVQVWSPWLVKDIDLIENVQRRAVRCIRGLTGTYEEKLKQIGLTTLKQRRERGDMIQTFKIVNKIDDVEPSTWFKFVANELPRPTRSCVQIEDDGTATTKLNIKVQNSRLNIRRHFFSNRVVEPWNRLPEKLKCVATVNEFKNGYDNLFTNIQNKM